jgi:hypothetical protein
MRYVYMALIPFSLLPAGCSSFIAGSGFDPGALETKEQVHAKFGKPAETGANEGESFETFRSRVKLRDEVGSSGCFMAFGMTLGLSEFLLFPTELCLAGRNAFFGQEVRFTYDEAGQVKGVLLDGCPVIRQKDLNTLFKFDDARKTTGVPVDSDPVTTPELPAPPPS